MMENKSKQTFVDSLPPRLHLVVKEGEELSLSMANLLEAIDSEIVVDVQKDGRFVGAFADFCNFDVHFKITVNLLSEGASCEWHLASLSSKKEKKNYETNVNHLAPRTTATVSNYGIAREESFLKFFGASFIQKGAKSSSTRQEAKIIVFDPLSDGLASPALQIDENDVLASHAAVVGRLNEQHLFYLESRGIDLPLAKRLIALGYLKPIEAYFDDEKLKNKLDTQIERGSNMFDPYLVRKDFPMFRNDIKMQGKKVVWLDNASTTFKPDCVLDAVKEYYTSMTANSHRGDYDLCYFVDKKIAEVRAKVASFLNANENEIVFTSGTTMGLNLVAFGYGVKFLKEGDEILLTEAEHASNVLPWFKVAEMTGAVIKYIPLDGKGRLTVENLKKTISPKTKIVAAAMVTNVLGFVAPAKEIAKVCHENGALFVLDGAQTVPHMPIDVKDLDCDFLAFSGHKLCGPTGIGCLFGKFDLLCKMDPFMTGGGMNAKFDMCGQVGFLEPPLKFEAGTQNIEGIFGLGAAIDYLEKIGMKNIEEYEHSLKKYAVSELQKTGNAIIYNPDSESGIVTFNIKDVFAQDAATFLNSRGIACRSGQHCAKILTDFLGTVATVRASFYFYTTKGEIDKLVDAVSHGKEFLDAYF